MPTQQPSPPIGKRYVTIKQVLQLYDVSDKTIERYIQQGILPVVRDRFKHVKIDLDVLEQVMREREIPPNPLVRRVEQLEREVRSLREQLEQMTGRAQTQQHLLAAIDASTGGNLSAEQAAALLKQLVADALADAAPQRARKIATQRQLTALEKRGLPDGTITLVEFVKVHQPALTLWEIKKAFGDGEIALTIYQREGDAKRNKREWWLTPAQHRALISYCQQRQITYSACPDCIDQSAVQQAG